MKNAYGRPLAKKIIKDYEEITGKTLKYGVFAVSQEKLGDAEIFGENGATSGVLSADVTAHSFDMFEIKVVGFTTDAQKSAKLVVSAYAITTKDDEVEVSYLQAEAPTEGSRYNLITFNDYNPAK